MPGERRASAKKGDVFKGQEKSSLLLEISIKIDISNAEKGRPYFGERKERRYERKKRKKETSTSSLQRDKISRVVRLPGKKNLKER